MKFGKFRKGQIAVVLTLAIATLLGVMALGTDVGIATKTGEDWGKVKAAMNGLITGGTLPATVTGNESQLVTVPIVAWGNVNGASQVTVLGSAFALGVLRRRLQ